MNEKLIQIYYSIFCRAPNTNEKTERAPEDTLSVFHLVAFLRRYSSNQAEKGRLLAPFWSITNCCSDRLHFHFALTSPHRTTWRVERPGAAEKGQKETKSGGIQLF